MKKQVTMDDSSSAFASEKPHKKIQDDTHFHSGIHIPQHMLSPGQDGYRTPTIEDYEKQQHGDPSNPHGKHHNHHLLRINSGHLAHNIIDHLHWKERIRHFTWTFFAMTMATGGIANVLYSVPFRFHGLDAIGVIFFLLNMVLFIFNVMMMSLRFYYHYDSLMASFLHPTERLFIPAAVVSFETVLLNISQYGLGHTGDWLNNAVYVLFWIEVGLALIASMGVYLIMWSTESFTIEAMTPIWIFPAYPLLILGPHAAVLSKTLEQKRAFDIIVGGFTVQGIGFLISLMVYSLLLYRLMTQKLPQESTRPGMFVSVGPSGFTVAGVIGMAGNAQRAFPPDFMGNTQMAAMIVRVMSAWISLWVWGLAVWFFLITLGAHWSCVNHHKMVYTMTWFSFVFPNTALITATFAIGKAFDSRAIQIVGCVMTPILILAWFWVVGMMIRAIKLKQILWPQRGEDKDEGGFQAPKRSIPAGI